MDRPDEALLAAAADGDDDAFYRRHLPGVTSFFLRRTGDPELAFDLTAETFAAAVVGCGRYRAAEAPAAAWLFGIAANKLRESLRRGRVEADARRRLGFDPVVLHDADLLRVEELACTDGGAVEALAEALPPEVAIASPRQTSASAIAGTVGTVPRAKARAMISLTRGSARS